MAKFGKWIGGGLGWTIGGPIGALAGFVLGSVFDQADSVLKEQSNGNRRVATTKSDYIFSLLVLVAAVLKADGKIMRSELDYVKEFFKRNFGIDGAQEALIMLQDLTKQNIPVTDVCHQVKHFMDHSARLQLIHFLFGIATADDIVHPEELQLIKHIAANLGISETDFSSIQAMFIPKTDWAYDVLEINPTVTNEEIKKAYKKMAVKYHPDKVSYLGEDVQKSAKEKFQKVNEAYQLISKERKMN
jgi:DnaJ like chaperone protein